MKYATGLDPNKPCGSVTELTIREDAGKKYLVLSWPVNTEATDVTFSVESSADLKAWAEEGTVVPTGARSEFRDTVAVEESAPVRRFLRLKVVREGNHCHVPFIPWKYGPSTVFSDGRGAWSRDVSRFQASFRPTARLFCSLVRLFPCFQRVSGMKAKRVLPAVRLQISFQERNLSVRRSSLTIRNSPREILIPLPLRVQPPEPWEGFCQCLPGD